MSIFQFLGRATPRPMDQLERDTEDAFETANAAWDAEHTPEGGHAAVTLDSLAPRTEDPVAVYAGLRFMGGPWILEMDSASEPAGFGAVLRPPQITANANNYNPSGFASAIVVEISTDAARDLTGLDMTIERRRFLWLVNRGNFTITLKHNSSSSTARNRFASSSSTDVALRSGGVAFLYYDLGSEIWRVEGRTAAVSVQTQALSFTSGGGNAQNFTLGTTLTNYQNAYVAMLSETGPSTFAYAAAFAPLLTSNTNIRVSGSDANAHSLVATIIEHL